MTETQAQQIKDIISFAAHICKTNDLHMQLRAEHNSYGQIDFSIEIVPKGSVESYYDKASWDEDAVA